MKSKKSLKRCAFPNCNAYELAGYGFCRKHILEISQQDILPDVVEFNIKLRLALKEHSGQETVRSTNGTTIGEAKRPKLKRRGKGTFRIADKTYRRSPTRIEE